MHSVDSHTLDELQIHSRHSKEGSILQFFDYTKTQGGQDVLKKLIAEPKSSLSEILSFQLLLKSISQNIDSWQLNVSKAYIAVAESYYGSNITYTMSQDIFKHWVDTFIYSRRHPAEFYLVQSGLTATLMLMRGMRDLTYCFENDQIPPEPQEDFDFLRKFLLSDSLNSFLKTKDDRLSLSSVFYRDYYFRVTHKDSFRRILDICYSFDAYVSIALTQKNHDLCFPEFVENETVFEAEKIWHPLIKNAIPNNFVMGHKIPLCLLTGANTSGKTTFLKTCGVAVYLAHLGWPIPAGKMKISFFDKLFTSIHLSDNLELGYSHFYNEIMRIKSIAEALNHGEKCFVIIDEIFRGTNQEDAFHCSKTVVHGFSNHINSIFLVSTHLYELLENYKNSGSISFRCFKTKISGTDFENTFQIEEGIASEKIGQLILKKVGIPELLENIIHKSQDI
ncbi:DNA mismatch repair protein MutS [Dyadobacter subterraneus]|uniref:DNA mismatch repair protein MutS n=1 Tax=Dyadobacter subterraneus TaxID=2773304 RepID=A0ABR9WK96_9BACT|nr:DNA mismatch repair protein MutS [Dyadobacter subterraneus]MBE9465929.1 DNA mismatch repair protein MutS [Dyadobacter subterraneus]